MGDNLKGLPIFTAPLLGRLECFNHGSVEARQQTYAHDIMQFVLRSNHYNPTRGV